MAIGGAPFQESQGSHPEQGAAVQSDSTSAVRLTTQVLGRHAMRPLTTRDVGAQAAAPSDEATRDIAQEGASKAMATDRSVIATDATAGTLESINDSRLGCESEATPRHCDHEKWDMCGLRSPQSGLRLLKTWHSPNDHRREHGQQVQGEGCQDSAAGTTPRYSTGGC